MAAVAAPAAALADSAARPFPRGCLWGVAGSGFQTEAGGRPANADCRSDWWAWTRDPATIGARLVTAGRVEDRPGDWRPDVFARDVGLGLPATLRPVPLRPADAAARSAARAPRS